MESVEFLLELFGGLVLLIGSGCLVGHLLKLSTFSDNHQKCNLFNLSKTDVVKKESDEYKKDDDFHTQKKK